MVSDALFPLFILINYYYNIYLILIMSLLVVVPSLYLLLFSHSHIKHNQVVGEVRKSMLLVLLAGFDGGLFLLYSISFCVVNE